MLPSDVIIAGRLNGAWAKTDRKCLHGPTLCLSHHLSGFTGHSVRLPTGLGSLLGDYAMHMVLELLLVCDHLGTCCWRREWTNLAAFNVHLFFDFVFLLHFSLYIRGYYNVSWLFGAHVQRWTCAVVAGLLHKLYTGWQWRHLLLLCMVIVADAIL